MNNSGIGTLLQGNITDSSLPDLNLGLFRLGDRSGWMSPRNKTVQTRPPQAGTFCRLTAVEPRRKIGHTSAQSQRAGLCLETVNR